MKLKDILSGSVNAAEWEAKGYELPKFDIKAVREKTAKEPTWVHFGGGNIFRAFPAAILNDAFGKCHLDQWKAERDKEYNGVSITNGKGLWLGDQFPRRDLFEYLTTDPYFTKNEDLAEAVSVIRAALEYRNGDKDAYAKLNHRKAKTLNHYPKMRRYDAWR